MDSTVINEIANQLGMAVDQAGEFIAEQLPGYAAMKAMQLAVPLAIAWSLVLVCIIVAAVAIVFCAVVRKRTIEADKESNRHRVRCDFDDYNSFYVFIVSLCIGAFFLLIAVFMTGFDAPSIYGWQNCPEAMLIDMALNVSN